MNLRMAWRMIVPREHGSWFFVLEPLLLVLPLCHASPSLILSAAAVLAFLARRPLVAGWSAAAMEQAQRGRARVLALVLLLVSGLAALPVLGRLSSGGLAVLLGMLLSSCVACLYEQRGVRRSLPGELAGVLGFGLLPALLLLAGGAGPDLAWRATLVLLLRSIPSFLSLRTFLRARKQGEGAWAGILMPPGLALIVAVAACSRGWIPLASVIFAGIFLLRSLWLLLYAGRVSATQLGISEAVIGVCHSLLLAWFLAG